MVALTGVVRHASVAQSRLKLPTRIGPHLPASNPPFPLSKPQLRAWREAPLPTANPLASALAVARPGPKVPLEGTSWIVPHAEALLHLGVRPNEQAFRCSSRRAADQRAGEAAARRARA